MSRDTAWRRIDRRTFVKLGAVALGGLTLGGASLLRPVGIAADDPGGGSLPSPPSFPDVPPTHPYYQAITTLASAGIIRGYADGNFGPEDPILRAQMAALICRSMGWETENVGTPFPDQGGVDPDLWRNVGALAARGVARGYSDGTYDPTGRVLNAQTISFITRALVASTYWPAHPDDPAIYSAVPSQSGHRQDLATYVVVAGAVPTTQPSDPWFAWDQSAQRGWFAQALYSALTA